MQVADRAAREGGGAALLAASGRRARRVDKDTLLAVVVLSPSLVAVAVFIYAFMLWTGYISLTRWNDVAPDFTFVGLRNFERLLETERFLIDMRNTAVFAAVFMSLSIGLGFVLAAFLDQRVKGEALFRTIYLFPFAISAVVTGVAWKWLMFPNGGLNALFEAVGLGFLKNGWYSDPDIGILAVTIPATWQISGYVMALYLAGLRGISAELREAAAIDGAGTLALYRHVIVPLLRPVTLTAVVILGNISLRVFDLTAAMTSSGAAYATDTPAFFLFQTTFQANRFSQGAAIAVVMLALACCLIVPYLLSVREEVER